jgi:hypothetical protein
MKKTGILLALILLPLSLYGQEKTLLEGEISHGGFGGPVVKFTSLNGDFGVLVGGRGGWIIDHTFVLGGGGYGLANNIGVGKTLNGNDLSLNFGYGGFEMEYIQNSDELIHYSAYLLIGAGNVSYRYWDNELNDKDDFDNDQFFIAEPAVNVELNITSFFRLNAGLSYRFITGANYDNNIDDSDLQGLSGVLTLKFGKF